MGKKFTNLKKKDFSDQQKQAGAELKKKKKDFLGQKLSKKLNFKAKNWPIIKKKKGHFRPKKQVGHELKNKKSTFLAKNYEKKIKFSGQKLTNFQKKRKKKGAFPAKKTS